MRLKRIELLGFKSFADRTLFEFGDETLTGVVGPNGCGKSNVVDALRWVLGEQRPTSMRGKEMTDVIFKGSTSRPGMQMAEVTLLLDNQSETLEGRGAEVSITRRVFKDGEGEYLLDGQKVRLKDIREMLFDTGLGSRGYSVLEQGRIDAVLSANPIDRRRIFEEAAGISRYRQRKHETELRLARVEQDLARLDDVTGELTSRVRSLKIQAGKAERWVEARDEWKTERERLVRHQLHVLDGDLGRCATSIEEAERGLNELRSGRQATEAQIQELEESRARLGEELERLSSEVERLAGDGRALAERRAQLEARVKSWEGAAEDEEQRAAELERQVAERNAELERWRAERAELEANVESARATAEEQERDRKEHARRYRELRIKAEEQNTRVLELLHQKTEAANTLRHLELSRAPLQERTERIDTRLTDQRATIARVRAEEEEARTRLAAAEVALDAAEAVRRELEERLAALDAEHERAEAECQRLEVEIARRASTIESLNDRERELADLDAGARAVWDAVQEGRGPLEVERVQGLVADHLRIGTECARALDTVLGERASALVVDAPAAALAIARWLGGEVEGERSEHGQAALTFPAGLGALPPEPAAPPAEGVVGPLRGLVACDAGFEPLADLVCRGVWVVADVAAGLALVAERPDLRAVTRAGELVDALGLVVGERSLAQGAVGRRSKAAELQSEVDALESERALEAERLASADDARRVARGERDVAEGVLAERREELSDAQTVLRTSGARARDLGESLEIAERERAAAEEERERLEQRLVEARAQSTSTLASFEQQNGTLAALEKERHAMEEERDRIAREEGRAQVEWTRSREQLGGLERRIADLERVCVENEVEAQRARRLSQEASESARTGTEESASIAARDAELGTQRGGVEAELERARAAAMEAAIELEAVRRRRDDATARLEVENAALGEHRLENQRLDLSREEVLRRAEEELELTLEDLAGEGFEPEDELIADGGKGLTLLDRRVRALKTELERLGPVNMDALSELEEVGGRLEFLTTQAEDLRNSRKALNETLARIESESERLFVETFEQVRGNFQRIFRQLFGGGRADVVLAEGEPVLEAGVEITARPPGREMLPIGLLSGGQRTMTALALLFAVFEARPSPFCVLDEVDAALDDANIQRFLGMINGYRATTQFLVVTHNKGSMAACDSLYGVTMQTKGVSRQVMVELDEVDEFVPEVNGGAKRPTEVDAESGEPVVELQPSRVGETAKG